MGYTINDFTGPVANLTGSGAGTLTAEAVPDKALVFMAATDYYTNGVAPQILPGGANFRQAADIVSAPYRSCYPIHSFLYPLWWTHHWWGWHRHRLHGLEVRLLIGFTNSTGDLEAQFQGYGLRDTALKVWGSSVSVDDADEEAVEFINASTSAVLPEFSRRNSVAYINVKKDDLVIAMARDDSYNYATAAVAYASGPGTQELFSFNPKYANRSIALKVWRIQADGTLGVAYNNVSRERFLQKLSMDAVLKSLTVPADPASPPAGFDQIWFELSTVRSPSQVTRPSWFNALADSVRGEDHFGKIAGYTKETLAMQQDDLGRERASQWKEIEIWGVDPDNKADIDKDEAKIYGTIAQVDARILQLEGRI